MRNEMKYLICCTTVALLSASVVQAQLTWDVVPGTVGIGDGSITSTNGTWDASTGNWTADAGANNMAWVAGSDAVFGNNAGNTAITVDIADSGVTVGDLTLEPGAAKVSFKAVTDNIGAITVNSGGATWDTGGRELEFVGNNNANDTRLIMTSGDTLTVTGGGTFDAGEKQQGANWVVAGASVDFTNATAVRACTANMGQFDSIKLASGSTFINERNANQWFATDFELDGGEVTFDNRFNRGIGLSGMISGTARLAAKDLNGQWIKPTNTNNTFSGGIAVDNGTSAGDTQFIVNNTAVLGPVPATLDSDNIILRNGGLLKMDTIAIVLEATRGITLDGSGGVINSAKAHTINGPITGDGQFLVGRNDDYANWVTLTSTNNDYTGGTHIRSGHLALGVDDALPTDGLLTIGAYSKNARFQMNGFNQTIAGLNLGGGNTKEIVNNGGGVDSTLTIDVVSGKDYSYNANIIGSNAIHVVKNGLGTQRFEKTGYSTPPASLTINEGVISWNSSIGPTGLTTVNSGGTLMGIGTLTANVIVNSGGMIGAGNPGGWNALKIQGDLDLSGMIDDNTGGLQIGFGSARDAIIVTNVADTGTILMNGASDGDLGFADFTFTDLNGYVSGTYAILVADVIDGTLDTNDLSGIVGDFGATGELSLSNNTVYLTIDGVDTSAYGTWASDYGLAKGDELGHADEDGYNNFQEFAFGGDPTNTAVTGLVPAAGTLDDGSTNYFTMVYGERTNDNPGVTYEVKTVDNLVYGTWTNGVEILGYGVTVDGITPVTNGIPLDGALDFLGVFLEKQD